MACIHAKTTPKLTPLNVSKPDAIGANEYLKKRDAVEMGPPCRSVGHPACRRR